MECGLMGSEVESCKMKRALEGDSDGGMVTWMHYVTTPNVTTPNTSMRFKLSDYVFYVFTYAMFYVYFTAIKRIFFFNVGNATT